MLKFSCANCRALRQTFPGATPDLPATAPVPAARASSSFGRHKQRRARRRRVRCFRRPRWPLPELPRPSIRASRSTDFPRPKGRPIHRCWPESRECRGDRPEKEHCLCKPEFRRASPLQLRAQWTIAHQNKFHIRKFPTRSRRCPEKRCCDSCSPHSSARSCRPAEFPRGVGSAGAVSANALGWQAIADHNQFAFRQTRVHQTDPLLHCELHTTRSHKRNIANCARNLAGVSRSPSWRWLPITGTPRQPSCRNQHQIRIEIERMRHRDISIPADGASTASGFASD